MLNLTEKQKELFKQTSIPKQLVIPFQDDYIPQIENNRILSESMQLTEILCDEEQIHFGLINSAQFEVNVANVDKEIVGKEIKPYLAISDLQIPLGIFLIKEVQKIQDKAYKKVVAYDRASLLDVNVDEWYDSLTFPITVKAFRDSLFKYLGLEQVSVTLGIDNVTIEKTIETEVNARTVLSAICELDGCFGRFNRQGKFEYLKLANTKPYSLNHKPSLLRANPTCSDYSTKKIDGVRLYGEAGSFYGYGDTSNIYVVQNNVFLNGKTEAELQAIAINLLNNIKDITYIPTSVSMMGQPYLEIGDYVSYDGYVDNLNFYIFKRTMTGTQALKDSVECKGEEYLSVDNGIVSQLINLNRQTGKLKIDVKATEQGIEAEVSRAKSEEEKLATKISVTEEGIKEEMSKTYATQSSVQSSVQDLQNQIDGAIETYFLSGKPTLSNKPASDWTTADEKDKHIGDLYYNKDDGKAYRFMLDGDTKSYVWVLITDADVTKALKDSSDALQGVQDVATNLSTNYSTTTQMNSAIEKSAQEISSRVEKTEKTVTTVTQTANDAKSTAETASENASTALTNANSVVTRANNGEFKGDKGDKGDTGPQGKQGEKGADGTNGKSIGSVINYYLATNLSTGVTASTSGWTTSVQSVSSSKKYLWNYEVIKYTDGTVASTTLPCIIGSYGDTGAKGEKGETGSAGSTGATGNGISSITEYYQVSTSNTTAPTSWVTTVPTMTASNKYLWNYEVITYTNGTKKETSKRVIGVYGDKGNTGATGATGPQGKTGATGPTGPQGAAGSQGPKGDKGAKGDGLDYKDTRNTNQPPSWYFTNYPKTTVAEFKNCSVIGLTGVGTYCGLVTQVPWGDSSGGYPKQTAKVESTGKEYWRVGTSANTWSNWIDVYGDLKSVETRVSSAEQKITADAIVSTVRSSTQYVSDLGAKVNSNEIISTINQTAEKIQISASKINFNGLVTANNYFKINTDGSMECKNAKIQGDIQISEKLKLYDKNYSKYVDVLKISDSSTIYGVGQIEYLGLDGEPVIISDELGASVFCNYVGNRVNNVASELLGIDMINGYVAIRAGKGDDHVTVNDKPIATQSWVNDTLNNSLNNKNFFKTDTEHNGNRNWLTALIEDMPNYTNKVYNMTNNSSWSGTLNGGNGMFFVSKAFISCSVLWFDVTGNRIRACLGAKSGNTWNFRWSKINMTNE